MTTNACAPNFKDMPNWVFNHIVIHGPQDTLAMFNSVSLSFQKLHPRPKDLHEGEETLEWNTANWGTKWEPDGMIPLLLDGRLVVRCETAWTPPTAFLCHLTSFYEGVTITNRFQDESWLFVGHSTIAEGVSNNKMIDPCDFTFAALETFSKKQGNTWYDHKRFIYMNHVINDCNDVDGEDCDCLAVDQSHLESVVSVSVSVTEKEADS